MRNFDHLGMRFGQILKIKGMLMLIHLTSLSNEKNPDSFIIFDYSI